MVMQMRCLDFCCPSCCDQETFNYKIAARPDRRRQFENELTSQMEAALSILTACLNIIELKEQVRAYLLFSYRVVS